MTAAARHCPSWADLQPELLGLVLRRLPSLADRVRLGAVCRGWRQIARQEPDLPPPLPWLTLLDGTFLGDQSGEIHRMHVPEDASLHGSVGDWLFLKRPDGKLELMNPFSKCVVQLPVEANGRLRDSIFHKLVPLSTLDDLSLEDSVFAVLTVTRGFQSVISIGRRHSAPAARTTIMPEYIYDAAFFEGKLYALALEKLFAFEIVSSDDGRLSVSSMKHVANAVEFLGTMQLTIGDKTYNCIHRSYLVATSGKLLQILFVTVVSST
ncbi:uncharacterized protein [Miscanthus floridulus]|uniref:uncharacterized protein n=1 Tax=Miscanthus floridulus TaxID=154761 RepID=UPI00345B3EB0